MKGLQLVIANARSEGYVVRSKLLGESPRQSNSSACSMLSVSIRQLCFISQCRLRSSIGQKYPIQASSEPGIDWEKVGLIGLMKSLPSTCSTLFQLGNRRGPMASDSGECHGSEHESDPCFRPQTVYVVLTDPFEICEAMQLSQGLAESPSLLVLGSGLTPYPRGLVETVRDDCRA